MPAPAFGRRHDDKQEDEQRGHEHLRRPLNTIAHTMADDEMGDAENDDSPEDGLIGVGGEIDEILPYVFGIALQMS